MTPELTHAEAEASDKNSPSNSLRPLLITVFTAKLAVSVLLLATASFAPPVSADVSYMLAAN
ncbi:hypothetical protein ACWGPT_15950 [Pseudorhizobium sp. NPDC055634]